MADVYEKDLAAKSPLTTSDFIRVVGSDNVSYKQGMTSVKSTLGVTTLEAEMDGVSVSITGNTDYLKNTNFYAYAVGSVLVISGWFQFKEATAIPAATTLITLGNGKQFKARYYLPLYSNASAQPILFQLECRENTAIARTREAFTPSTTAYYHIAATVCIK